MEEEKEVKRVPTTAILTVPPHSGAVVTKSVYVLVVNNV
jgi:hypothetical protein